MELLRTLALVILLAPFIAFLLDSFVVQRVWRAAGLFTIVGVFVSFLASCWVFLLVDGGARIDESFPWLAIAPGLGDFIDVGGRVGRRTARMRLAVAGGGVV